MAQEPVPTARRRTFTVAAPLLAGALVLSAGACSKKDEPATSSGTTIASTGGTSGGGATGSTTGGGSTGSTTGGGSTGTSKPKADGQIDLKKTIWMSGFKITLGEEALDKENGVLSIAMEVENLSENDASLYSTYQLEADGAVIANGNLKENKTIVGKAKVKDEIVFNGMGTASGTPYEPDTTTLVIGSGSERQARILLNGEGDEDVDNKPIDQAYTGDLKVGPGEIKVEKTQVRFDHLPGASTQVDSDTAAITLTGKIKNTGTDNLYFDRNKITLKTADGTTYTADYEGPDYLDATKSDDFFVTFLVEGEFAGDYTFEFTQGWGTDGADVSETAEVTISETASGGTTTGTTKA